MSVDTLDALLEIKMKGPNIEEFDFKDAIEEWKSAKKQVFI